MTRYSRMRSTSSTRAHRSTSTCMEAHRVSCDMFAAQAQNDISWKQALAGPLRDAAIESYHKEINSLQEFILERVEPGDERHARYSEEYRAVDGVDLDADLTTELASCRRQAPQLRELIGSHIEWVVGDVRQKIIDCLLYTSPSPRDS